MLINTWNAALYEGKHGFVWEYGKDLLELLSPRPHEQILDLGCGTGQLTDAIAQTGAIITGIDADPSMVAKAQQNYSHLHFAVADARDFQLAQPFDAVFSNAVLHWIPEADAVLRCVYQSLKSGGRFVTEFGGKGNIKAMTNALQEALTEFGLPNSYAMNPWYFPSIGEYSICLERQGFEVGYAVLFDRPTPLEDGEQGMANWMRMFASRFLQEFSNHQQLQILQAIEARLKNSLYRDGIWTADYRRIRVVALRRD